MLLARRQRQRKARSPVGIAGLADQPSGHLAQMRHRAAMKPTPGSAKLRREAEALALANRDVGAEFAGRFQKAEREGSAVTAIASAPARW